MRYLTPVALILASCATPAPAPAPVPAPAEKPSPLDQPITLSVDKGSLHDVLDLIARKANLSIIFDARVSGTVTMSVNDQPAGKVLDSVAKTFGCIVVREPSGIVRVCPP